MHTVRVNSCGVVETGRSFLRGDAQALERVLASLVADSTVRIRSGAPRSEGRERALSLSTDGKRV